jgi:hypothetical protein
MIMAQATIIERKSESRSQRFKSCRLASLGNPAHPENGRRHYLHLTMKLLK